MYQESMAELLLMFTYQWKYVNKSRTLYLFIIRDLVSSKIFNQPLISDLYDLFINFLKRQSGSCIDCQWKDRHLSDLIRNILICVPKMNESLMKLEWHESE